MFHNHLGYTYYCFEKRSGVRYVTRNFAQLIAVELDLRSSAFPTQYNSLTYIDLISN